jgi:hypothetical protein
MNRTACSALLAVLALGAAACTQAGNGSGSKSADAEPGKSTKSGALVHTPAPPPPEIHDDATSPRPPIVGGYTNATPVNDADTNTKAARDFAVVEIYKRFPQRGIVESATVKTQVVAGLNYQFHIVMTGGKAYEAVVYRDLQGKMSVSSLSEAAK